MKSKFLLFVLLLLSSAAAFCQHSDFTSGLSPYSPQQQVSGTIRNWGNPYIPELLQAWQNGFRKYQPGIKFESDMKGTEAAMAGLYANVADVVFIGREPYQPETDAFEAWFGYKPTELKITSGSYATQHKTFALMVYVNKANPLTKLSLKQLDAVYGAERRRGAPHPIRTWGQLGLSGKWAKRPIHVYGYNFDTGMAGFFRLTVLKDSYRWNPEMKDFDNGKKPNGDVLNAGVYILDAVAKDPNAIGFANVLFENPSVKKLALAEKDGGPYVEPSEENAWKRSYPLTRYSTVCINRAPGKPVDPKVKEFLRYILSKDGMEAVVRDRAFLPLNADAIREELKVLE